MTQLDLFRRVPNIQFVSPFGPNERRWPTREDIERVVGEVSIEYGVTPVVIIGASHSAKACRARRAAWHRVLIETGCTILGLARVWGCERRSIQRALDVLALPKERVAA